MRLQKLIAVTGAIIFAIIWISPAPAGLSPEGKNAIGIFILSLSLWITNIIPLAITGLLGMALVPLLNVLEINRAFSLFGNRAVFFILGALILAAAIHKTGLGERIAYRIMATLGENSQALIRGVLITAALLSCLMPEHAVAALLFPIVMQLVNTLELKPGHNNLGKNLFISMAWGAVIGGITTYLGGARNLLAVSLLEKNFGITINFFEWIAYSIPLPLLILPVSYLIIVRSFPPEKISRDKIEEIKKIVEMKKKLSTGEKKLLALLVVVIGNWLFFSNYIDISITAILGGVAVFALNIVNWDDIHEYVNWGIVLMYGGAMVIAGSLNLTGAAEWLSRAVFGNYYLSFFMFIVVITLVSKLLTEGISNVAAVAVILPLAFSWGSMLIINPRIITLAVALSSGLAFCLPMGTPPNAIAFSAGYFKIREIVKAGIILNFVSWLIIILVAYFYWPLLL